eukprot:761113-Hanusia_phi.AAC.1
MANERVTEEVQKWVGIGNRAPNGGPVMLGDFVGEILFKIQKHHLHLRGDVASTIVTMSLVRLYVLNLLPPLSYGQTTWRILDHPSSYLPRISTPSTPLHSSLFSSLLPLFPSLQRFAIFLFSCSYLHCQQVEGLVKQLDPDFDVVGAALPYFARYAMAPATSFSMAGSPLEPESFPLLD